MSSAAEAPGGNFSFSARAFDERKVTNNTSKRRAELNSLPRDCALEETAHVAILPASDERLKRRQSVMEALMWLAWESLRRSALDAKRNGSGLRPMGNVEPSSKLRVSGGAVHLLFSAACRLRATTWLPEKPGAHP